MPTAKGLSRVRHGVLVTVAGTLAVTAMTASASFAQTKSAVANKTSVPSLASLEKQLTSLETPPSSTVSLTEAGSSLFYPLFASWALKYPHASSIPLQASAGGSGKGVSGAIGGTINIGASDAYLPASDTTVINIPEVVSAQQVNYNLPGLSQKVHLKLSATVLNNIYAGQITNWDDPAIAKLNKGVKIPSHTIVPIHRSDSSGDTFIFTSYLSAGDPGGFMTALGGPQTLITWPNPAGALAESGNTGMLQTCQVTPGCIAYIGVSYLNSSAVAGLGEAQLQNGKGNFELPTAATINAEVASFKQIPTNGALSMVYSKSAPTGYPIVNFEYAIVLKSQPSATTAQAIQAFLAWGMDPRGGASSSTLYPVHFQPLAPNAMAVAINLIKSI
jgi:phosphate transport system substrate-binding protein